MGPRQFDALARALTNDRSRRSALLALLGGTLGLLGLTEGEAKKKKKGKKKKKRGSGPPASTSCTPGCGPCSTCQDGGCVNRANDTDCTSGTGIPGRCLNGTCNPPPTCRPRGTSGCTPSSTTECCGSGFCTPTGFGGGSCLSAGGAGTPCLRETDCVSGICTGYRCQAPFCQGKSNGTSCGNGKACLNGSCLCPASQTDCNGVCKDLNVDAANCGTCGMVCSSPTSACKAGSCCRPTGAACTGNIQCCSGICARNNNGNIVCV